MTVTSFSAFNKRHNAVLRAYLDGAKQQVHAANILKRNFGYDDEQLKTMLVSNQRGVQSYGSKPRIESFTSLGAATYAAKQAMFDRLMKRCNVGPVVRGG